MEATAKNVTDIIRFIEKAAKMRAKKDKTRFGKFFAGKNRYKMLHKFLYRSVRKMVNKGGTIRVANPTLLFSEKRGNIESKLLFAVFVLKEWKVKYRYVNVDFGRKNFPHVYLEIEEGGKWIVLDGEVKEFGREANNIQTKKIINP